MMKEWLDVEAPNEVGRSWIDHTSKIKLAPSTVEPPQASQAKKKVQNVKHQSKNPFVLAVLSTTTMEEWLDVEAPNEIGRNWIDHTSKIKLASSTVEPPQASQAKNENQTQNHSNHSQNSAIGSITSASLFTSFSLFQHSRYSGDSIQTLCCGAISRKIESNRPGPVVVISGDTNESADIEDKSKRKKFSWCNEQFVVSILLTVATMVGAVALVLAIAWREEGNVQPMTFTPTQTPSSLISTTGTQPPTQESTTAGSSDLPVSSPTETPTLSQTNPPTKKPLTGSPSLEPDQTQTPTKDPNHRPKFSPTELPTIRPTMPFTATPTEMLTPPTIPSNPPTTPSNPPTTPPTPPPLTSFTREYSVRHETIPTQVCGNNICEYAGWSGAFYFEALLGFWYDLDTLSHYIAETQGSSHQLQAVWLECMLCTLPEVGQLMRPTNVKIQAFAQSSSVVGETGVTEGWVKVTEMEIEGEIPCSSVACPDSMHNLWAL